MVIRGMLETADTFRKYGMRVYVLELELKSGRVCEWLSYCYYQSLLCVCVRMRVRRLRHVYVNVVCVYIRLCLSISI